MKIDYKNIEEELNTIKYRDIGIGSLLALEFFFLYKGTYKKKRFRDYMVFIKIVLRAFFIKIPTYPNKTILYYKSGDKNHHNQIFKTFSELKKDIIVTGSSKDAIISSTVFRINVKLLLFYLKWILLNYKKFKKVLSRNGILVSQKSLFFDLIIQILRVNFWDSFFYNNEIKILIGDYDRLNISSPIYLTANKHLITTVVIQHGVINPPYGYTPLLANYVFVWGEMQKKQYRTLGVAEERIKVTGSPIISEVKKRKKEKFNVNKNIVLAVNPILEQYVKKQIQDFSELSSVSEYKLFIKIHPSQSINKINRFVQNNRVKILPKDIKFNKFVDICDVLITHNSGLANECILNDIPVIILDNLPILAGNGAELNSLCNVPLVNDVQGLIKVLEILNTVVIKKQDLYFKTGANAKQEIAKEFFKLYNT